MPDGQKAFAVAPAPLPRKTAYTPRSSSWRLYRPEDVAEKLGVSTEAADRALEETGFHKAIRIREELIRWKERLRAEERQIQTELTELNKKRQAAGRRLSTVREGLENVRNILRLPREASDD